MHNVPLVGLILGVVVGYAGFLSLRAFFRAEPRKNFRTALVLLGCGAAVALFVFGEYRPSPTERYYGLPFFSFALLKKNGHWRDYLGPLTFPALIGNLFVGFVVPFIFAEAVRRFRRLP
ncbi:MAG TPA: hypothetical protein VGJ82_10450 [Thermoanaerobaculia bacterium]